MASRPFVDIMTGGRKRLLFRPNSGRDRRVARQRRPADAEAIPRFEAMARDEARLRGKVVGLNVRIQNEARVPALRCCWAAGEVEPGLGHRPVEVAFETP